MIEKLHEGHPGSWKSTPWAHEDKEPTFYLAFHPVVWDFDPITVVFSQHPSYLLLGSLSLLCCCFFTDYPRTKAIVLRTSRQTSFLAIEVSPYTVLRA